jgi:hypothetical protein
MPVAKTNESLVDRLRRKLDGKPAQCMAVAVATGERCKKQTRNASSKFCSYHRTWQKGAAR